MRQQQQRSRNRNRGRKSSNPMSRNFESNGPDVKIRGNASHIAEKYSQLARDALTSGDTVMAENYYQHAEHYFRIVAANQQQISAQREQVQENNKDQQNNRNSGARNTAGALQGEGPQPDIEVIVPVVEASGDQSDAETDSESSARETRAPARRNSRRTVNSRRTSRVAKKSSGEADAPNSVKHSNGSSDGETLTDDASSLPSSLIGKVGDEASSRETSSSASEE